MHKTGTRLSTALLGYFIFIILLLTLNPFYLIVPERVNFTFQNDINNLISNILVFLPVGFFYRLATRQRGALLLGAIISFNIEAMQLFIPARTSSIVDILANTAGAGTGALLYRFLSTQFMVSQSTIGRLRLETPLMSLIYLLVPLLWANSLAVGYAPYRWILMLMIGTLGTIIMSELFRHWWKVVDWRIAIYASLATGVWVFLGTSPGLRLISPILIIGLGVMSLTALLTTHPQNSAERRFERATLKKIFPVFVLYLILQALWNPLRPLTTWHWTFGFTNQNSETSLQFLFPRIEYLVAFTALGYIFAEWRGRSETSLRQDLPRLFLNASGVALVLEYIGGFQIGPGASLIRTAIAIVSTLFGGTIYHLLRAHIRFLLNR